MYMKVIYIRLPGFLYRMLSKLGHIFRAFLIRYIENGQGEECLWKSI